LEKLPSHRIARAGPLLEEDAENTSLELCLVTAVTHVAQFYFQ
jgi:hypothetical protein